MNKKTELTKNTYLTFTIVGVVVFFLIIGILTLMNRTVDGSKEVSADKAPGVLKNMLDKVEVTELEARKGQVQFGKSDLKKELPDIEKYPLTVEGNGDITIEIFCSPEKAGINEEGWLNEMAEEFNEQDMKINGKSAKISIRSIASGMAMDYIVSGKYIPDAYTPSNELWGAMMEAKGIKVTVAKERLLGNVAGILLSKEEEKKVKEKYGDVSIKTIIQATAENEIAMGYTNPFSSSTGLNFLLSTLQTYDKMNPLSNQAIEGFEQFQKNVPFVAYTTMQMSEAVESGSLNGLILEYQTYVNTKELRNYSFTPFGIRHDNPVYAIGELSQEKKELLNAFLSYCSQDENQEKAKEYGFNEMDSYQNQYKKMKGSDILDAQNLWKEKKDSGHPIAAVFVADISGSMSGAPIRGLKESLINGSQYIDSENSIGLVSYSKEVYIDLPLKKFDLNQRSYFIGAVEDLSESGTTATFNAILVAADMLLKEKEANPDTKLMMFVLSDGETNEGYYFNDVKGLIKGLSIPIYTIGYNAQLDELKQISEINEAASINADSDDVIYQLKCLFNAQM